MRTRQPFRQGVQIDKKPSKASSPTPTKKTQKGNILLCNTPIYGRAKNKSDLMLTPLKFNQASPFMKRSSSIPDFLDSPDVTWERRERSVSPVLPITPSLPRPNKPDVNQYGFTNSQMSFLENIALLVLVLICILSASTVKTQSPESLIPFFLYSAAALSICIILKNLF